jgi:hypothetical protein
MCCRTSTGSDVSHVSRRITHTGTRQLIQGAVFLGSILQLGDQTKDRRLGYTRVAPGTGDGRQFAYLTHRRYSLLLSSLR